MKYNICILTILLNLLNTITIYEEGIKHRFISPDEQEISYFSSEGRKIIIREFFKWK